MIWRAGFGCVVRAQPSDVYLHAKTHIIKLSIPRNKKSNKCIDDITGQADENMVKNWYTLKSVQKREQ